MTDPELRYFSTGTKRHWYGPPHRRLRVVLVAVDRTLCTASVSDENIIILCKKDTLLYTFYLAFDSSGDLFAIFKIKDHVCDLSIKLEVNTCILQIFFSWKEYEGF